jgi:heme exporter protein A
MGRRRDDVLLRASSQRLDSGEARLRLVVSELSCERGGRLLFSDLSFSVDEGQAAILTGPNGAGKTSLISIIAGLLRQRSGAVRLEGVGVERSHIAELAHLVGHRDGLKPQLLVGENLLFSQQLLGWPTSSPKAALAALGLGHVLGTPTAYLSAGQHKRVALSRLLLSRRPLWLLDEPTAALDDESRTLLANLMHRHLESGGLIVAATHAPIGIFANEIRIGS